MNFRSLFSRNKPAPMPQPITPIVAEMANPEPQETPMKTAPVMIPAHYTGSGDLYLEPSSVYEVAGSYGSLIVRTNGGGLLEWTPELAFKKSAKSDVLAALFSPEEIEKIKSLEAVSGRAVNPELIQTINFISQQIHFTMTDGSTICSGPSSFDKFKRVVAIVHGADAAKDLKPLQPPTPKPAVRNDTGRKKTITAVDAYEKSIQDCQRWQAPKAAAHLTAAKVTSTDPTTRLHQVEEVMSKLETDLMFSLSGCPVFANDDDHVGRFKALETTLLSLRQAHARLFTSNDTASLDNFRDSLVSVHGALSQLPGVDNVNQIKKLMIAQLGRLSELKLSEETVAA
jgi:hypothetical protein